jgi:hypothetical protein
LYVAWMPILATDTGYDPVRYYTMSTELIDNHWTPDFSNLNYVGILYYYGAIFYIFGHNPVIPALINVIVTLMASLYLIKVCYEIKGHTERHDWWLALVLLLPEMLWYDVMTSRETLIAAMLMFVMLCVGRYLANIGTRSLIKLLLYVGLPVFSIASIRTSMLLPLAISITLMVLFLKDTRDLLFRQRLLLLSTVVLILSFGSSISTNLGGYDTSFIQHINRAISARNNIALNSEMVWSEKSIGMLLMPEGLLQSVLYLPPRMLLYLIAPLPNMYESLSLVSQGNIGEWQTILTSLSSIINIIAIPYAAAGFLHAVRTKQTNSSPLMFHICYWITFISIAGGNLIIHERYRVMATPLLWGCTWLGARTSPKYLILVAATYWYALLALSVMFYLAYKLL